MASGGFLGWLGELFGVLFGRRLGLWTGCGKVNQKVIKTNAFSYQNTQLSIIKNMINAKDIL